MRAIAPVILVGVLAVASCGPSPAEETADLCRDLGNLRGTLGFLDAPPSGATVGQVRGSVDRLDPTFTRLSGDDEIPTDVTARLIGAQDAYREALDPYGDDEPITTVSRELYEPARRLHDAVRSVLTQLGCDAGAG
jgi:hypothetical protein